ncbi:PTS sugar transporter subunit IIC [bacterium]|nr:PTS sugar transporter subunit IIC [bacterium]MBU1636708.1 PTS sugar transporter subunit IIC [bacterium]MBU1920027.1 PTS sugar transporter subunit IIC [bacterium]
MQLIWAALAGMVVYLDTTAIAQILICQPIIACPLWGYFVGEPEVGLIIGAVFQLIYLGNLQIGAARFAEGNIGAFIAVVLASQFCESNNSSYPIALLLAFFIGLVAAQAGSYLAPTVRRIVGRIVPQYVLAAEQGDSGMVRSWFMLAVGVHLVAGFVYSLFWLVIGSYSIDLFSQTSIYHRLVESLTDGPLYSDRAILLFGSILGAVCAVAFRVLIRKKTIPLFIFVTIFGAIVMVWYFSHLVDRTYSLEMGCLL